METRLEYESVGYYPSFKWVLTQDNYKISGRAKSVRGVYRAARKAVRRHRKLSKYLGEKI